VSKKNSNDDINELRKAKENKIKNIEVVKSSKTVESRKQAIKYKNSETRGQTVENRKNYTHTKKKKKKSIGRKIFRALLLIILIAAIAVAVLVKKNGGGLKGMVTTIVGSSSETVKNLEDITFLVLGKSQNMTDTILIAKYSPKNQTASLVSIPRDTYVGKNKETATAYDKINARYAGSGISGVLSAVNNLTGLNIQYFAVVDTKALRDFVDAIGGIDFDVPIDMDYDDSSQNLHIHLKAGMQHLDGEQAENVVRFRHNNDGSSYPAEYGDNDIGRMKTQRAFMVEVLKQAVSISNITKISDVLKIVEEEVETNVTWEMMKDYIAAATEFDTSNIRTTGLPLTTQMINGVSFVLLDEKNTKAVVKEFFIDKVDESQNANTDNDTNSNVGNTATNGTANNTANNLNNTTTPSAFYVNANSTSTNSTNTNSANTNSTKTNSTNTNSTNTNSTNTNSANTNSTKTNSTNTNSTNTNSTKTNSNNTSTNKNMTNSVVTTAAKSPSKIKIKTINGTGQTTRYKEAIAQLKEAGYKVEDDGKTNLVQNTVIINRGEEEETAEAIKSILCTGFVQNGENDDECNFTLIIGNDY